MAFTYVNSNSAASDASSTTITVQLTGVTAGHLICLGIKHEGAATTYSISDGTTTLTNGIILNNANGDLHTLFSYLPASVASGSVTYTVTFGAARTFRRVVVYEYSYTGTAALDAQPTNGGAYGSSTAVNSGNMTTTGTDEVSFGLYGEYHALTVSSTQINGVASDHTLKAGSFCEMWSKVEVATYTGAASATLSGSNDWQCSAISFKTSSSTNVTVNLTGSSMTATSGSVTVKGNANVSVAGSSMTATSGSVTVRGNANVAVTGSSLTITSGSVTITTGTSVTVAVTGSSITISSGNVSVSGDANVATAGSSMTITSGSVTISGDATIAVAGSIMNIASGTVTVSTGGGQSFVSWIADDVG